MKLPPFEYASPTTLAEAIALLAAGPGTVKAIAGGQSLLPVMAFRLAAPRLLVDLRRVPGLDRIDIDDRGVRLGAKVRWRDIEDDARLRTAHPLLQAAMAHVAHYQIRNRGTVGGSLAHADPAAEMPGIAVTCDAQLVLTGSSGTRVVPAADFFVGVLSDFICDIDWSNRGSLKGFGGAAGADQALELLRTARAKQRFQLVKNGK